DPVTAIGLVSGVLTFVSFSATLVKSIIEIQELNSILIENRTRKNVAEEMERLSHSLLLHLPDDIKYAGDEISLSLLVKECYSPSKELISLLESLRPE
ncbi:hypothetical protein QBC36DRAFT_144835, partial [Triangularia setosa]